MITALKIGIAVALVWYLFKSGRLTTESLLKLLNHDNAPFLFFSAFAFLCSQVLSSVRLVFLLKMIDVSLGFVQAFKLTMIGNFFNIVVPGSVGGDIVKGYYLAKDESKGRGRSTGIVIMDRAIGLFALLLIGGTSVIYLSRGGSHVLGKYQDKLQIIVTLSVLVLSLFLSLLIFGKNRLARQKLKALVLRVFKQGFFYNIIEAFGAVTRRRRYLIYALFVSILVQLLSLFGVIVLVNIIGTIYEIIPLMAVSSVVMLMGVVPVTPGNIGWTEFIATLGWSAIGLNYGAIVFFYWRLVTLFCSIPGGIFYFSFSSNKRVRY